MPESGTATCQCGASWFEDGEIRVCSCTQSVPWVGTAPPNPVCSDCQGGTHK